VANYAHRLKIQDDINTDYIISGRYKFKIQDPKELGKHIFEDLEEGFYKKVKPGDFLVAGCDPVRSRTRDRMHDGPLYHLPPASGRRAARRRKHYAKSLHDPKSGQRKTINRGRYAAYDKKVNHETE